MSVALFAVGASAAELDYEMDVNPDDASLGANAMIKNVDGWGSIAAGDFNDPPAAGLGTGLGGYAPIGYARFVDSGNTGRNGYYRNDFAGPWTADMRIFVEQSTSGGGTIGNMNVGQASNSRGRAIGFLTSNDAGLGGPIAAPNAFRFQVRSAGIVAEVDVPNNPANPTPYHMIRIVMPNDDTLLLYDLENDTDAGPGVSWNLLMTAPITGATGRPDVFTAGFGGISLGGIHSSSETTAGKDIYDWVRINNSAALGATDPIMAGPETASISITSISFQPDVQLDFTAGATDTAGRFAVQRSSTVAPASGYADVSATITQLGAGSFRAVLPPSGDAQFYRIRR